MAVATSHAPHIFDPLASTFAPLPALTCLSIFQVLAKSLLSNLLAVSSLWSLIAVCICLSTHSLATAALMQMCRANAFACHSSAVVNWLPKAMHCWLGTVGLTLLACTLVVAYLLIGLGNIGILKAWLVIAHDGCTLVALTQYCPWSRLDWLLDNYWVLILREKIGIFCGGGSIFGANALMGIFCGGSDHLVADSWMSLWNSVAYRGWGGWQSLYYLLRVLFSVLLSQMTSFDRAL